MLSLSSFKFFIYVFLIIGSLFLIKPHSVGAYSLCDDEYRGCSLPPCSTCRTSDPGVCSISAPGVCNACTSGASNDCCPTGSAWTKYKASCRLTDPLNNYCDWRWIYDDTICSTADKCTSTSNNPYLNAGACDCSTGGVYKTCCSSNGNLSTNSCTQQSVDTTNPPFEGTCPSGTTTLICGVTQAVCDAVFPYPCTTASCGQSACCTLASAPTCNTTMVCSDTCDASAHPNTCYSGNGTKSCTYTTYSGSNPCNKTCIQPPSTNQPCDKNNCSSGYTCSNGTCTQNPTPSPSVSPSPSPPPSPAAYSCWVNQATNVTTSSANVNISQQNNSSGLNYNRTWWSLDGNYRGYTDDSGSNPQPALFRALLSDHNYSVGATRGSTTNGGTPAKDCDGNNFTTNPPPVVAVWDGNCTSSTAFSITGDSNINTHARRDDNGALIWQGEKPPKTLTVPSDVSFSWYSEDPGGNQPRGTAKICSSNSPPPPPPSEPSLPQAGGQAGDDYYFRYSDGSYYDGFGVTSVTGVPFYSSEGGNGDCSINGTAEGFTPYTSTLNNSSSNSNGYKSYGSCCCQRYWEQQGFSHAKVAYNCGATVYPASLNRLFWPQFPVGFSITRTLTDFSQGGYGGCESQSNWGTPGGCIDTNYADVRSLTGFHFGPGINICSSGWYTIVTFTVRPPVKLTIQKNGSGTVTGSPINNRETFTKTREGGNAEDPKTLSSSCSPGNVITSYSSVYGAGANGSGVYGDCWNPVSSCGSCTIGGSSCSVTYNNTNCNHNDAWYCSDAKLTVNCAPPSITPSTTNQTYYKVSLTDINNTFVTLTANPTSPSVFDGWDSGCYENEMNGNNCTVLMDGDKTVIANFNLPDRTLTVKKEGDGDGNVSSEPPGTPGIYSCSSSIGCTSSFRHGTSVTLTPYYYPANTTFTGWSGGGCSGTNNCTITMDADKTVTATFAKPACSYLKTVGGDVYSGGNINMSCSP